MPQSRSRFWSLLTVPGIAWLALFYVAPLGLVAASSFATANPVGFPVYGLHAANYRLAFQPEFLPVLLRTLGFAALATGLCLLAGYPTAYVISRYGGRLRMLLVLGALAPWLVDYLIRIYAWLQLLGSQGLVADTLRQMGLATANTQLLNNTPSVMLGLVYNYLPLMIVLCYVAVEQMDHSLVEAGKDLYGSAARVFLNVTVPNTLSGIISGSAVVFLLSFGDWATVFFLGGPNQFMIGNLVEQQFNTAGSLPFGAALTVLLLIIVGLVIAVVSFVARRLTGSSLKLT
jgi:spermidine/putrescine transport system permease protein